MKEKKIIIVGGGFGGLAAAKSLGRKKGVQVTLIDRRNYHLFQPLLYQVAMAGLSPAEIAAPIRGLLSEYKNIEVLLGNVSKVNPLKKQVKVGDKTISYDYLILACGAKHSYFGNEDWECRAPGLKTLEQATEIRRRVLTAFEMAEKEEDPVSRKRLLTFVVVGGGPTGVELAGAIGEISRFTLSKDFRRIDPNQARVVLVEAGTRILAGFSEKTSKRAARSLEKIGVQIWTSSPVSNITDEGIQINEEFFYAKTVLWAAGVKPSSLNNFLDGNLDKQGRIAVSDDLSLAHDQSTFVIGDQASFLDESGLPLPGLAPVATQQGTHAAKNILADLADKPRSKFQYLDKGQMATIGRRSAVLEVGSVKLSGTIAWYAWLLVHIYYLIGFRNKLFVLIQWAWHYLTYSRGSRLIVHKEWRSYLEKGSEESL